MEDAVVNVGDYKTIDSRLADKKEVLRAIHDNDEETMREISDYFYKTSGIYSRLCRYMASLYRYDWIVTPYVNSDTIKNERTVKHMLMELQFGHKEEFYKLSHQISGYKLKWLLIINFMG